MKKNPYSPYLKAQKKAHQESPDSQRSVADSEPMDEMAQEEKIEEQPVSSEEDASLEVNSEESVYAEKLKNLEEERLRLHADMDNMRKRLIREKEEAVKFASENVLKDLLPSLDNLDLAISYGKNNPVCKDLLTGIEMTKRQLLETLEKHGLTEVGKEGDAFDPQFHEAMSQEERDDMEPNHIARLFQKGYLLKDRLLRPAKVVVSKMP